MAGLWVVSSCGGPDDEARVHRVFTSFQDALMRGDAGALRTAVTRGSELAVGQVPLDRARSKRRLEVRQIRRRDSGRFDVEVRDPNADGAEATYVVVRDDGRWRVDLVASLAANHATERGFHHTGPADLTPEQIARIRAREAASVR